MKCAICNGESIQKVGTIEFDSKSLGKLIVPNIIHHLCKSCGETLINVEQSEKVISYVKKREREAIEQLPIGNFISSNEAAKILGVTKQAFSKNPKIKNGLIYSVDINGRKLFDRRSVVLFNKTGNGKYRLMSRVAKDEMYAVWKTQRTPHDIFRGGIINIVGPHRKHKAIICSSKHQRVLYKEETLRSSKKKKPQSVFHNFIYKKGP